MKAKDYEKLGKSLRLHKQNATKENVDFIIDDALEGVMRDLEKDGVAQGRTPEEWNWSENFLYESFLVSFGNKGNMYQAIAIKPDTKLITQHGKRHIQLETPIYDNWKDAKNEINKYIRAYHLSTQRMN